LFNRASASFFDSSGTFGLLIAAFRPPALQSSKKNVSKDIPWRARSTLVQRKGKKRLSVHIVRVLALVRSGLDVTAVELVVQHVAGVLLGVFGSVGVVEVGFVAADDVAWVGHFEMGYGGWVVVDGS
jgi:hypothetical protein